MKNKIYKLLHSLYFSFFYQMSLLKKLLLSYSVLIFLPMLLLTVFTNANVSKTLIAQFQYSSVTSLEQTSRYLNQVLEEIISSTDKLAFDSALTALFQSEHPTESLAVTYKNYLFAQQQIARELESEILYSADIFVDGNPYFISTASSNKAEVLLVSHENEDAKEVEALLEGFTGKLLWYPRTLENKNTKEQIPVITAARYLKSARDYSSNIGILTLNLKLETLRSYIDCSSILPGSLTLLTDHENNLLLVSDEALFKQYGLSAELVLEKLRQRAASFDTQTDTMLLNAAPIAATDWTLISLLPYDEMLRSSRETRNTMLAIMFALSTLFYLAAFMISKQIAHRLHSLSAQMKEVHFENYISIPSDGGTDEISDLIDSYRHLLNKIDDYAQSQYELGIAVKTAELNVLQAQINPHFLYNTLDLLYCIAWEHDAEDMSEIISLLTRFYKLSLNHGLEMLSVREALELITVYIRLQNLRFESSIELVTNIEPQVYDCQILKLLLQPIVENAVIHGILEKDSQCGTISIDARLANDTLYFTITDDGVGMPKENSDKKHNTHMGYGTSNVLDRIHLHYGNAYGLSYESEPGVGTSVSLWLPATPPDTEADS